jgi:hypothetical protein
LESVVRTSSLSGDNEATIAANLGLGRTYLIFEQWTKAQHHLNAASRLAAGTGGYSEFAVYSDIAMLHALTADIGLANQYFYRAIEVLRRSPNPNLNVLPHGTRQHITATLSALRVKLGDPEDPDLSRALEVFVDRALLPKP